MQSRGNCVYGDSADPVVLGGSFVLPDLWELFWTKPGNLKPCFTFISLGVLDVVCNSCLVDSICEGNCKIICVHMGSNLVIKSRKI